MAMLVEEHMAMLVEEREREGRGTKISAEWEGKNFVEGERGTVMKCQPVSIEIRCFSVGGGRGELPSLRRESLVFNRWR